MEMIREWDENVSISSWKEGREKINKVIRKYNKWVCNYLDDRDQTFKLLNKINKHLMKPYSNSGQGTSWREELLLMKSNAMKVMNQLNENN